MFVQILYFTTSPSTDYIPHIYCKTCLPIGEKEVLSNPNPPTDVFLYELHLETSVRPVLLSLPVRLSSLLHRVHHGHPMFPEYKTIDNQIKLVVTNPNAPSLYSNKKNNSSLL